MQRLFFMLFIVFGLCSLNPAQAMMAEGGDGEADELDAVACAKLSYHDRMAQIHDGIRRVITDESVGEGFTLVVPAERQDAFATFIAQPRQRRTLAKWLEQDGAGDDLTLTFKERVAPILRKKALLALMGQSLIDVGALPPALGAVLNKFKWTSSELQGFTSAMARMDELADEGPLPTVQQTAQLIIAWLRNCHNPGGGDYCFMGTPDPTPLAEFSGRARKFPQFLTQHKGFGAQLHTLTTATILRAMARHQHEASGEPDGEFTLTMEGVPQGLKALIKHIAGRRMLDISLWATIPRKEEEFAAVTFPQALGFVETSLNYVCSPLSKTAKASAQATTEKWKEGVTLFLTLGLNLTKYNQMLENALKGHPFLWKAMFADMSGFLIKAETDQHLTVVRQVMKGNPVASAAADRQDGVEAAVVKHEAAVKRNHQHVVNCKAISLRAGEHAGLQGVASVEDWMEKFIVFLQTVE